MVVGEMAQSTEVVVIGAGPGGYVAAIRAAQLGKKVVCIDYAELGGICLNQGCIPSKALIHASSEYHALKKLQELGITVSEASLDAKQMQAWKGGVLQKLRLGIAALFKKYGVERMEGKASFDSSSRVIVQLNDGTLRAVEYERCIIATGSRPVELQAVPFDREWVLSSEEALDLQQVPKTLVVIGGGYIGVELGTVYAKLGSQVTIVEALPSLLNALDADVRDTVLRKLTGMGVTLMAGAKVKGADKGKKEIIIETSQGEVRLQADKVLVSVGRKPLAGELRLQNTRVAQDEKGFIKVNAERRTTDPRIYAVGDVVGGPLLAHKASAEGKVAAEAVAGKPVAFDAKTVPAVVYSDPEVATTGISEEQAKAAGRNVKTGKYFFRSLGRALTMQETDGFVKVLLDADSTEILGVQIVGANASDMISEASLMIEMGALAEDAALTIHPHPSLAEALQEALENALGKSVHT